MTAGEYVHLTRRRHKLSMQDVSDLSGVSKSTVCRLERDEGVFFTSVVAVCNALEISLDYLAELVLWEKEGK